MLRITWIDKEARPRRLKVEGRIAGPEIEELSRAVALARAGSSRVVLDMSGVTFIDRSGVELLQHLRGDGAELEDCSSFITTLVNGERR